MSWMLDKTRPICPQICEQICVKIAAGEFKPNDRLMSVREVAVAAGVNPNTVQRAYTLLEERGFIHTIPKKGVFVTFGEEGADNGELRCEAVGTIVRLKEMGATREELLRIIEEVYAND